jgi:hypothetical protein
MGVRCWWLMLVAHAYNLCYSGGRDQEDCSSKPAQANSSSDLISKKNLHKKELMGVAQGIGSEFKLQYCKEKKKKAHGKMGEVVGMRKELGDMEDSQGCRQVR